MQVGDHVNVQGMPGRVIDSDTAGPVPLYLVLMQTPSIRWFPLDQLVPPTAPAVPAAVHPAPVKPNVPR